MIFAGFNRRKKGTISNGDWDRDGVINRKDCEPLNFRKQGPEHNEDWDTVDISNDGDEYEDNISFDKNMSERDRKEIISMRRKQGGYTKTKVKSKFNWRKE